MYWIWRSWHFWRHEQTYADGQVRYFVLVKRSPFKNRHPALEPDLVGTCAASSVEEVDRLAFSFVSIIDQGGVIPGSPYTSSQTKE